MKNSTIIYYLLIIGCLNLSCSKKDKYFDFRGERVEAVSAVKEKQMTSRGAFIEGHQVIYKKCTFFMIADSGNKVIYASTNDRNFILDNTVAIGTAFSSIESNIIATGYYQPGWAYVIPLKSDWNIGFLDTVVLQNKRPSDTSKVTFIYWSKD